MAAVEPPDPLPPDENVGPLMVGVSTALVFVAVVAGSLRIWVRWVNRILGWDDYLMMIVLPIVIARLAIQGVQLEYGNGRHRWYIDEDDYVTNNMLGWYTQHTLFAGLCLLKCSIMFLLLRIKSTPMLRLTLGIVMAGLVITNGGCMVILLAECKPISAYWTGQGVCWDNRIRIYSIYFTISYSLATDLLCSLLPLIVIWKVRIPTKTKIAIWGLMSLGLIATGFGIARAASLGISTTDLSYVFAIVAIWSNAEFFIGVIAANLALSRHIYMHLTGKSGSALFGSSYRNNRSGGTTTTFSRNRAHQQTDTTGGLRDDIPRQHHYITSATGGRRPSLTRSDNSDIPLEPRIQKKTEFWISESDGDAARSIQSR